MTQKRLLVYAGIGLVASGIATIFVIYQGTFASNVSNDQVNTDQKDEEFTLEEVHANPALVMHIHSQIELRNSGQNVVLPAEIGIASELWHDHSLDQFGPSRALLAPIHTHDESGTIHIESVVKRDYTLGEFLSIWGMGQDKILKVTSDDGLEIEDFRNHVLTKNERLIIEVRGLVDSPLSLD
ncbi:MAG TPA: hypothetical protein VGQ03_07305 [Nitrososphaera sp.]|nr:hypothetical protein [Nitrososphaera sp.]